MELIQRYLEQSKNRMNRGFDVTLYNSDTGEKIFSAKSIAAYMSFSKDDYYKDKNKWSLLIDNSTIGD